MTKHVRCPHCSGRLTVSIQAQEPAVVVEAYSRPAGVQATLPERVRRILAQAGRCGRTERYIYRHLHCKADEANGVLRDMMTAMPPEVADEVRRDGKCYFVLVAAMNKERLAENGEQR